MKKYTLYIAKALILFVFSAFCCYISNAQNVAVNTTGAAPNASALLDVSSTAKGLLLPRMTNTQMNAIAAPAVSLVIFNTTTNCFMFWTGALWQTMSCPCTSPAPGSITGNLSPLTNSSGNGYSIAPVPGATGYMWTITPSGSTITAGQGSDSITVSFGPLVQSYTICVYDSSIICVKSPTSCLVITTTNCIPGVVLDATANANGASTFNITTANANEIILIAADGWPGVFSGSVTVDGNPATLEANAQSGNSGVAAAFAYLAPLAGAHTIAVTETGYSSPYYLNLAESFAENCPGGNLSLSKLVVSHNDSAGNLPANPIATTVNTVTTGNMLWMTGEANTGTSGTVIPTGAISVNDQVLSIGTGINVDEGHAAAPIIGSYRVDCTDASLNGGGGMAIILIAIEP